MGHCHGYNLDAEKHKTAKAYDKKGFVHTHRLLLFICSPSVLHTESVSLGDLTPDRKGIQSTFLESEKPLIAKKENDVITALLEVAMCSQQHQHTALFACDGVHQCTVLYGGWVVSVNVCCGVVAWWVQGEKKGKRQRHTSDCEQTPADVGGEAESC